MNNILAPWHFVDGDAHVDGFVDQNELPARKLVHKARTVQILVADLHIKITYHPLAVCLGALRPESDFELVVEAPLQQSVGQGRDLWSGSLDLAELNLEG